jgi:hypothetical protein
MVIQFRHCDNWESTPLECEQCGWKGTFYEGLVDGDRDGAYCYCPNCREEGFILASHVFPTLQELQESSRREDQQMADLIEWNRREFQSKCLREPEQLPDIAEASFTLTWDCVGQELAAVGEGLETVIRHGDRVLFTEPAIFECYWRYEEVARIVRQKYGERVTDLIPTPASRLHLWGDAITAPGSVQHVRKEVFGADVGSDWIL